MLKHISGIRRVLQAAFERLKELDISPKDAQVYVQLAIEKLKTARKKRK